MSGYTERRRCSTAAASASKPADPRGDERSWGDFYLVFSDTVRADIEADRGFFEQVAAFAVDPPISLRAVDIVAWWAGDPKRWSRFSQS